MTETALPWTADKLEAVLTACLYQHFTERLGPFTFSSRSGDEEYELLDGDPDDDVLTFQRKSDGARFDVEFWAGVTAVRPGASSLAAKNPDPGPPDGVNPCSGIAYNE